MNQILITKLNNREESALKEIFNEMFHKLHYYSFKITKNWQASEDIVINVFISFWNRGKPYENWDNARNILFTYTKNASINFINSSNGKYIYTNDFDLTQKDNEYDIDYDIMRLELIHKVHKALSILPEQCQEIMLLYNEGLTGRQVAARLGLSESTVYTQYSRSLAKLKKHFQVNE